MPNRRNQRRRRREDHYALGVVAGITALGEDRRLVECIAKLGRIAETRLASWPDAPPRPQPGGNERWPLT